MRCFFYILIPLLVSFRVASGQFMTAPLQSDPNRGGNHNLNSGNLRMAATAAVVQVKDTLNLPFFEDFTTLFAPIDTVFNQDPVLIKTLGLHGLYDKDRIAFLDTTVNQAADNFAGIWYVKRISPFSFQLYKDINLSTALNSFTPALARNQNPPWVRLNTSFSPNPDTLKWMNKGGVYINNRYGVNPPSYNVATFDGMNARGKAYKTTSNYVTGFADSLISLPIDLSKVKATSSLMLSFYIQKAGLGDIPEVEDSIYIQFRNNSGVWKNIWGMKGGPDSTSFNLQTIPITDPLYFYKGFQFRFLTQGELSGSYDVWNLDYIYLDTNRTISDTLTPDVAIQKASISVLKNYTAMPYKQFFGGDRKDVTDAVRITLNSMDKNNDETYGNDIFFLTNEISHTLVKKITLNSGDVPKLETKEIVFPLLFSDIPITNAPCTFKYFIKFSLENKIIKGVQYKTNDSISGCSVLNDYYAYDDSSAEMSAGLYQTSAKMAVKFPLNIPDTIVAIDVYFPHILNQLDSPPQPIDLIVWSSIYPETQKGRTPIVISYTASNNQYKRYTLTSPLVVKDSVFIGYQQSANFYIPIGYDKNTDSKDKIYYTDKGAWVKTAPEMGSLMIRPVFKSQPVVVSGIIPDSQSQQTLDCEVYPNPSSGVLNILGDINNAVLTDLSGKVVFEQNFPASDPDKKMDLQNIPDGFYLLRLSNEKASTVKKVVLAR